MINYYKINDINCEENSELIKIAILDNKEESFKFLVKFHIIKKADLIIGVATLSSKKEFYIQKMESLSKDDMNILFQILTERISKYSNKPELKMAEEYSVSSNDSEDNHIIIKLESLENENFELTEENKLNSRRIEELTSNCLSLEFNYSDLEKRYNELLASHNEMLTNSSFKTQNSGDFEEAYKLSIELSEIRGKLAHKEQYVEELLNEKENLKQESKIKIMELSKQNFSLKENLIKYDILKEKMEKLMSKNEECQILKTKNIKLENLNHELEEKVNRLKMFIEADKIKVLKNVEDINFSLEKDKSKFNEIKKENEFNKEKIVLLELENKNLQKKIESLLENQQSHLEVIEAPDNENDDQKNILQKNNELVDKVKSSLEELEIDFESKKVLLECEYRMRVLINENESLNKLKEELIEKIKNSEDQNKILIKENTDFKEKNEKLRKKLKEENEKLLFKVDELSKLIRDLEEKKSENEESKLTHLQSVNNLEKMCNNKINDLKNEHQIEIFKLREITNSLTIEINLRKKENSKLEAILENNKILLSQKNTNSNLDDNIKLIESLKEITKEDIINLKKNLTEKEILIENLNIQIGDLTIQNKKYEKLSLGREELVLKDEQIKYYKNKMEKGKIFYEEQVAFMSKMFYELSINYLISKNSLYNPINSQCFNWSIEND